MSKLIYIEWCDAHANSNWMLTDEALDWAERTEWVIREVGWIVKESREYLCLASVWKPGDEWTDEQFKNLQKIPKTWIRKRIDLTKAVEEGSQPKPTKEQGAKT